MTPIVDAHAHVIGDEAAHPSAAAAAYRAPPATLDALIAVHDRFGVTHGVLVQVSLHGTDNGLMVDALRRTPGRFRGVAVVDVAVGDADLRALGEAGVVGLRLNLAHGGGPGEGGLDRYGAICREMGWHLQVFAGGGVLTGLSPRLLDQAVPLVLDHFGGVSTDRGLASPEFEAVLGLVRDGAWVKLSGPYRVSREVAGFADTVPFGRALLRAAPDRCLWGTDWPHVASAGKAIDVGRLLALADATAETARERSALLFANAARLYGFPLEREG